MAAPRLTSPHYSIQQIDQENIHKQSVRLTNTVRNSLKDFEKDDGGGDVDGGNIML